MPALYTVTTGKVTLTAGATKSLILLSPAASGSVAVATVKLRAVTISMDASAGVGGVQFDLYRVSSLGGPVGTATSAQPCNEQDGPAASWALAALTTEPTAVSVIDSIYLQPFGGGIKDWQPYGAEGLATKQGGARIGLRYTTPASVAPDCIATLYFEE